MSKNTRGLGKGLGALLKKEPVKPQAVSVPVNEETNVKEIPLEQISPNLNQPRTHFAAEPMDELTNSIKRHGVLQPLIVKKQGAGYEIIAGERRYRAAKAAGLKTVPVIVKSYSDIERTEVALIENLQREDLNVIEEALAYSRLLNDFSLTQEDIADKIGKSRSRVANIIRLLRLPEKVQQALRDGIISMGQAKPLLSLSNIDDQLTALEVIVKQGFTARQAENLVKALLNKKSSPSIKDEAPTQKDFFVRNAEDKLKMCFGTRVIISESKKRNVIEIEFKDRGELERILADLTHERDSETEQRKELLRKFSRGQFTV